MVDRESRSLRVNPDLWREFTVEVKINRKKIGDVVEEFLKKYVKKSKKA